ncbi:MAG: 1-acyl-sn-glycerol-3-phosphate acyltransferase [Oscillospiraceae bacterium]|nr:1-acyl-sn-glycerol-3-phosphate acyltransferase [Oscillospiraceae bacterium]
MKDKQKRPAPFKVQKVNRFAMSLLYRAIRCSLRFAGVRIHTRSHVEELKTPAIVLCNHGSFIDFIYAAALLRKWDPHFVVARLYFYNTWLRWALKLVGAFPKSMFVLDTESTKNCLRVLKDNGVLVMMPEARLSTVGRFEDIQSNTYSFLKKVGANIYTVKICGDYFADPKWGKGFRPGAVVEAELELLYTAEQLENIPVELLRRRVEERLSYDEFQWLEERPHIHYRSKNLAEGLENILTTCPRCGEKFTLTTLKNRIRCESCGMRTSINRRYSFPEDFDFPNFAHWYDWQREKLEAQIKADPGYALTANVELRLPGNGRGLTRHGGNGVCTLNRAGLVYTGTRDGETVELFFPIFQVYRLLFGAGENFEIYDGTQILYFVPEEKRSAVEWYMASRYLYDSATKG